MKSPFPDPPRKSLTLQKAEKVWLKYIRMSSRMSATAGTGTVTFFYCVMQNIVRKTSWIIFVVFFLLFDIIARLGLEGPRHFFFVQRGSEPPCKYWFLVINLTPWRDGGGAAKKLKRSRYFDIFLSLRMREWEPFCSVIFTPRISPLLVSGKPNRCNLY